MTLNPASAGLQSKSEITLVSNLTCTAGPGATVNIVGHHATADRTSANSQGHSS